VTVRERRCAQRSPPRLRHRRHPRRLLSATELPLNHSAPRPRRVHWATFNYSFLPWQYYYNGVLAPTPAHSASFTFTAEHLNIEALYTAPPEALAHSPSQMPLSCPVAPPSQHELHKDGGGGGGCVARRARAAQAPKAKSCATPGHVARPPQRPPQRPAPRSSRARPSHVT